MKQYSPVEMEEQRLAARGVPRPAFLDQTQFSDIVNTIEREGLPKGNQVVVIELAEKKGYLARDNNYQSKVEDYMLYDALTESDDEEKELQNLEAGWKQQVQQMEGGTTKNYTLRRAFNRYVLQKQSATSSAFA